MAEKNRFSKPVAFNHTMAEDKKILSHIDGRNFSGYVKDLIMADIKREAAQREELNKPLRIIQKSHGGGIKIVVGANSASLR